MNENSSQELIAFLLSEKYQSRWIRKDNKYSLNLFNYKFEINDNHISINENKFNLPNFIKHDIDKLNEFQKYLPNLQTISLPSKYCTYVTYIQERNQIDEFGDSWKYISTTNQIPKNKYNAWTREIVKISNREYSKNPSKFYTKDLISGDIIQFHEHCFDGEDVIY